MISISVSIQMQVTASIDVYCVPCTVYPRRQVHVRASCHLARAGADEDQP